MTRPTFRPLLGCLVALGLLAQQPPPTEVVLSASSSAKLVLGMATPRASGLADAVVKDEFSATLTKDLDDSGVIATLQERLPGDAAPAKAWRDAGAQWLLTVRFTKAPNGELQMDASALDTAAEKGVFTKAYRADSHVSLRRFAHNLADDLVGQLTGERGVSSSQIVFVRAVSSGVKEIFQMDRDGQGLTQITHHGALSLAPTVASDSRLAYITYKGGAAEIWGQRRPGGPHERIFPTTSAPQTYSMLSSPAWSPDGRRLAFVMGDRRGNSDIVVLDLASNRLRRLTDGKGINTEPTWNPNGTQLAFTSDREGGGPERGQGPQIFLMQDDGSNLRRLTHEGSYNASPAWSPNGAMVAYASRFEGKFDLFVYKLGEGKAYQITTGISTSESPSWSPDERRLVFTSNRFGRSQVFTTDLSGRQIQPLSGLGECQSPRWVRAR
jgi:TolB protein